MTTETDYDFLNRPLEQRAIGDAPNGFNYVTQFRYDDAAHTVTQTDPRGFETTTVLDAFDRVHRVEQDTGDDILETINYYDAGGNLSKTRDPEGRETDFTYDGLNRMTRVDYPLGLQTTIDYDGEGNKVEEINRRDLATRFDYDNLGRLTRTEIDQPISGGPDLAVSRVIYDDANRIRIERDARDNPTTFEMDEQGRVTKITDALGEEQAFQYDGVNKIAEQDKRGLPTAYDYDRLNRLTKVTNALTHEISTDYDDAARTVTETDRRDIVKTTQLDALGRLIRVTRAGIVLERHDYDGNNNRTLSTDANGNQTGFAYDGANRLTARTDAFSSPIATTTSFQYDRVGNLLEEKDGRPTGRPFDVKNTYDELNRLTAVEDAEGNVTQFEYDAEGNKTVQIEPKSDAHRTELDYGELNELIEVRMADGGRYVYEYDPNRNRTMQSDAENNVVEFAYDELNRVTVMTQDPGGFAYETIHTYDANGNETKLTDPKLQEIDFTYDELNRLKTKTYGLTAADFELLTRTHAITYHYDENDNLTQIDELKSSGTDPPAVVSSFKTYDPLDRLASETDVWAKTLTYGYDNQGNRTSLTDPDSVRTEYKFDELNRLEKLTLEASTAAAQDVEYEYFENGLKKRVQNPNGTASTYNYDTASRMTSITHTGTFGTVSAYDYTYDENGNRIQQIEENAGRVETTLYDYDLTNRLKTVTYEAGSATANQVTYTYDRVGNRLTEQAVDLETSTPTKHLTYAYDAINRLDAIDDLLGSDDVAYEYDQNGNPLTKTKAGVTTEFLYDIRNQLGEVRQDGSVLGRYGYDSESLRILKIGDDGRRHYTYDQLSVTTEANASNTTVSKYDYGLDQLVSLHNTSEGRSFFHLDLLRSTSSLTDSLGGTRQSILYDAWGNERDRVGTSANNFTFTGHEKDDETGLIYAGARFYDADIGRFLTQDSFLGIASKAPSLHRYLYANQNPLFFVDPTGFAPAQVTGHRLERTFVDTESGRLYFDLPTVTESVQVRAYDSRGSAIAATLDVQLAAPVERLAYPASVGLRGLGATGQGLLAVGLAMTPEPTLATKVGAAYFGSRSLDEFQALGRELYTGEYTESFAQQGATALVDATTDWSPETNSTVAGVGLTVLDLGVGFGTAPRAPPPNPVTESLEGLGRSAKPHVVKEGADNVAQAAPTTAAENVPTKVSNGRTYELRPSNGGTGPRRWHRADNANDQGTAGYSRDLVDGNFKKNAQTVRQRDSSCQYCQSAETTSTDHVVSVYDVDAAVGAQILTKEQGMKLLNELDNLLGSCSTCNSSKGAQLPGNVSGTWMPRDPSPRAIDIMRKLGTWSDEGT